MTFHWDLDLTVINVTSQIRVILEPSVAAHLFKNLNPVTETCVRDPSTYPVLSQVNPAHI